MGPPIGQPAVARDASTAGTRRLLRRIVIASMLVSTVAYLGVLGWFALNEDRLLFHAVPRKLEPPPASLRLNSRDVALASGDGTPLVARLIPTPTARRWWLG